MITIVTLILMIRIVLPRTGSKASDIVIANLIRIITSFYPFYNSTHCNERSHIWRLPYNQKQHLRIVSRTVIWRRRKGRVISTTLTHDNSNSKHKTLIRVTTNNLGQKFPTWKAANKNKCNNGRNNDKNKVVFSLT